MNDRLFQKEIKSLPLIDNDQDQENICMVKNIHFLYFKIKSKNFLKLFHYLSIVD
jgi:hypothetical protein